MLSTPMVDESVSIWNTLSFMGVEVLVDIAITGNQLIGGIFIDGFVIIKSFTQAPIFNFLVLNMSLPLIFYWSSQTITFVLPTFESETIRQWYIIFVSWAAQVGIFMYDFSNMRTSSRSNSSWLVRRFVYFVGKVGCSGIINIPKT